MFASEHPGYFKSAVGALIVGKTKIAVALCAHRSVAFQHRGMKVGAIVGFEARKIEATSVWDV